MSRNFYNLIVILILFSAGTGRIFSQHNDMIWYFGNNAGLDFNSGNPVVLTNGQLNTQEGCATITDAGGALLFYTDGITVWNKNHLVMNNGTGLSGGFSTTQSAIIEKLPGSGVVYYIFTAQDQGTGGNFSYSVVDMSLQGSLGSVTAKNVLITSNIAEKITAVTDASNVNIWVMVHDRGTNILKAFLLSNSGISASPVSSTIGDAIIDNNDNVGQMKFSPDSRKLAVAYKGSNFVDLFDFNNATGVVSNFCHLNLPAASLGVYGLEFSPSSNLLYTAPLTSSGIFQWNVTLAGAVAINASRQLIGNVSTAFIGSMQLAPDHKIYVAEYSTSFLGRINNPDVAGAGCNYVDNAVSVGSANVTLGLPDYVEKPVITPLPVQLISFYGKENGMQNMLYWTTASEINNDCFTLQRSTDQKSFETIGIIKGAGNSTLTLNYSFPDDHPATGMNYYRLKQTDFNGQISFSRIIALSNRIINNDQLIVYPNPSFNFITLSFANMSSDYKMEILNIAGEIIFRLENKNKIDISSLKSGMYFLKLESDEAFYSAKFFKK